jgi:hypothetical protein
MVDNFDFSIDNINSKKKFWVRVFVDIAWLLLLSFTAIVFIISKDIDGYSWISVIFFLLLIFFGIYSTWRNEMYLLVKLKLDLKAKRLKIVINKFDKLHIEMEFPLNSINVELKELRLGSLYVPNYMLIIRHEKKIITKQKSNLVWGRYEIKEMVDKLNSAITESKTI